MFQAFIKYLSRCTCIRKVKRPKNPLHVRKKPPDKTSQLKWLKENMRRELDLKRIITKIYCFEKNFELIQKNFMLTAQNFRSIAET